MRTTSEPTSARRRARPALALSLIVAVAFVAGCKAKPLDQGQTTAFLGSGGELSDNELYPFHKIWLDPSWNAADKKTIYVGPVNTDFVKQATWWTQANLKGDAEQMEADLANLATRTRGEFEKRFREDPKHRFAVVEAPRADSLTFELALVDVVPNKAALGALGLAATVVAAPVGAAVAAKETAKGSVAIEGRIKDGSGRTVGKWADREKGKFGPINLRRATWYGEINKIVEEWAEQWVRIANAKPGEKVKDTRTFTLMPW